MNELNADKLQEILCSLTPGLLRQVVEGVEDNNSINDSSWSQWEDADHAISTYLDADHAGAIDDVSKLILAHAIQSNGESLTEHLAMFEQAVWGQNFAGSWWDRSGE